jgi:hypothetical protein
MKIHEVLIYTFAGIEVATYPKARQLQLVSSWLTANRLFSVTNNFTDNQQIINMKLKFSFLHNSQHEISFVVINDRVDPTSTIMTFLRHVRDEFTSIIPEGVNFNRHDENLFDFTAKLKGIVDDMIEKNNAMKNRRKIRIVP